MFFRFRWFFIFPRTKEYFGSAYRSKPQGVASGGGGARSQRPSSTPPGLDDARRPFRKRLAAKLTIGVQGVSLCGEYLADAQATLQRLPGGFRQL